MHTPQLRPSAEPNTQATPLEQSLAELEYILSSIPERTQNERTQLPLRLAETLSQIHEQIAIERVELTTSNPTARGAPELQFARDAIFVRLEELLHKAWWDEWTPAGITPIRLWIRAARQIHWHETPPKA